MNYQVLVNRDNLLDKTYIPNNLVDTHSRYNDNIFVVSNVYKSFLLMRNDALKYGYDIDIMSGYRSYKYQEKLYNKTQKYISSMTKKELIDELSYILDYASEHQTGLAIDICVYKNGKCFIEYELNDFEEIKWLYNNAHRFGFILRYIEGKEDITGYNFEPWHFRYVGNMASYIYYNNLTLEDLF